MKEFNVGEIRTTKVTILRVFQYTHLEPNELNTRTAMQTEKIPKARTALKTRTPKMKRGCIMPFIMKNEENTDTEPSQDH